MNYIDITQPNQTLSVNLNTSESTETIVTESEELVTNGNFDTDSDWNLGTGVIIANSKLTKNDPSVGNTSTSQGAVLTVGKTYKYKLVVSGNLTASDKVVVFSTDFTSDGTYEGYFTANSTSLVFSLRGSTNVYSIDNVSVKEITEENNGVSINLSVYADGSDSLILNFDSSITSHNYYQAIEINSTELTQLKDETQYNIIGVDSNNKVIYRGKFQTTSKDILDYSINENKYTQKINSNNYTILD